MQCGYRINMVNILRDEEPDPLSGPPKGRVNLPSTVMTAGKRKGGLVPGEERISLIYGGGPQTEQKAQMALRLVNDLGVVQQRRQAK